MPSPFRALSPFPRHTPGPLIIARAAALATSLALAAALAPACATAPAPTPNAATAPAGGSAFPGVGAPTPIPSTVAFESLEGPLWLAAQNALIFADVVEANGANAHIYRYDPSARTISVLPYPAKSPTSTNGMAVDPSGRLIVCERYNGRLVRVEPNGTLTVLADRWPLTGGKPLNAPNDVTVRADGNIYFTDPTWGARKDVDHAPMGAYRIAPDGTVTRILDLENPNGVAVSPDGTKLYVGSDSLANIYMLPLDASGAPGAATVLVEGAKIPRGLKVPDGICVDDAGDLYVPNNDDSLKDIAVFDPAGHPLGRIAMPFRPSNCTFGGADRRTMYVTTLHAVYEVHVPTPGAP
jgi:sugar lactone lactonase YvrE